MIERRISLSRQLSIRQTFGILRNGVYDPCVRFDGSAMWRATRTPEGPATLLLTNNDDDMLRARAWGPGGKWCLDHLEEFAGEHFLDLPILDERIREMERGFPGMRIPRLLSLVELAIPTVLAQRVTVREAFSAYTRITKTLGEKAPGPANLLLPPDPKRLGEFPTWWFHRFGVERKRAQAVIGICKKAAAIDRLAELPSNEARASLLAIPGIGLWTAGVLGLYGLGDHDSVIVGDFHFPNHIAWALAGEVRGDDQRMLELLEPHRPQRGRVQRIVLMGGSGAPKFGPRYNPIPIASY